MSMIRKYLSGRPFLKNLLTLMSGTLFSQIITVASIPILARIYTPEDFGVYAIFVAVASMISIMAAGRYELAIIIPECKKNSINILALCFFIITIVSIFLLIILFLFGEYLFIYFHLVFLPWYMVLLPVYVFFLSSYTTLYYWFNREKQYQVMSISRMVNSCMNVLISLIAGIYYTSAYSLILAAIAAQLFSVAYMWYIFIRKETEFKIETRCILFQFKRYKDFLKFSMIGHLILTASQQMPVYLLNVFYGTDVVGYFSLAQRCINMPLSFITQSLGDIFREQAANEIKNRKDCSKIYDTMFKRLAVCAFFPFLIFICFSPIIFSIFLGEQWMQAGYYVQILSIMFYFRTIASPLSNIWILLEKQRKGLVFNIAVFIISFTSIYFGWKYTGKEIWSIGLYSFGYSLMYLLDIYITRKWAHKTNL